jgi:hypothetical protein
MLDHELAARVTALRDRPAGDGGVRHGHRSRAFLLLYIPEFSDGLPELLSSWPFYALAVVGICHVTLGAGLLAGSGPGGEERLDRVRVPNRVYVPDDPFLHQVAGDEGEGRLPERPGVGVRGQLSRVLRAAEQVGHPVTDPGDFGGGQPGDGWVALCLSPDHQGEAAGPVGEAVDTHDQASQDSGDRGDGLFGEDLVDGGGEFADDLLGDRGDDCLLAREVPVYPARGHAGRPDDVVHRRSVEAVAGEFRPRGVQDLLAALMPAQLADPWHAGKSKANDRS